MADDLAIYKDTTTGTVYVLAWRDRHRVTLRDLDSEPGDPRPAWLWSANGSCGRPFKRGAGNAISSAAAAICGRQIKECQW